MCIYIIHVIHVYIHYTCYSVYRYRSHLPSQFNDFTSSVISITSWKYICSRTFIIVFRLAFIIFLPISKIRICNLKAVKQVYKHVRWARLTWAITASYCEPDMKPGVTFLFCCGKLWNLKWNVDISLHTFVRSNAQINIKYLINPIISLDHSTSSRVMVHRYFGKE